MNIFKLLIPILLTLLLAIAYILYSMFAPLEKQEQHIEKEEQVKEEKVKEETGGASIRDKRDALKKVFK